MADSHYEFTLEDGVISGKLHFEEDVVATFQLRNWEAVDESERIAWQEEAEDNFTRFGRSSIGDSLPVAVCDELLAIHMARNREVESVLQSLEMDGEMTFQQGFSAAIYMAMNQESSTYMRMNLQDLQFYEVQNDSIKWNYNGAEDQLTVQPATNVEDRLLLQKNVAFYIDSLRHGVVGCRQATVRGIEAVKFKTTSQRIGR